MKKQFTIILISLFILSLFAIPHSFVYAAGVYCFSSGCQASVCVNNSCGSFPDAYAGDTISLVISDYLELVNKVTVGDTTITNWNLKGDHILEFVLPEITSKSGIAVIYVYASDGGLIADGDLTISAKPSPPVIIPPPQPACTADTWWCGNWGACSPQGIQTRSCTKTFDCSFTETASPVTSQYCVAPNQPQQQTPTDDLGIANQNSIIKSTVKLICPVDTTMASQGSGTVIDSKGTILTNKHVIDGTPGCLVGFIDNYGDEPYFGDRQIADIYKVSSDADVAILKLRNPANKNITFINISNGNSSQLSLGDKITTYGYPAMFGTNITYTSGDFSGVDGNYLKTTAIIEHGNSGGGAYLKNGTFVGIPSAVVKGSLNSMGYVLSINKINSWLNNSPLAYDSGGSNSYSRVSSILDDIDLSKLNSLNLFIADDSKPSSSVGNLTDGTLARVRGTAGVYLISNNQKRPIKSTAVFLGRGYKWGDIVDVDASALSAYPLGPDLTISEKINITPESQTFNIKASVPSLRVRGLPSSSGKIITSISNKKTYSVIDQQNGWYQIYYTTNKMGWVMSQYTTKLSK